MMSHDQIKDRIRAITRRGKPEPCFICGKHLPIVELHHLISVAELARLVAGFGLHAVALYIPTAWLCPNHHAIWHLLEGKTQFSGPLLDYVTSELMDDLPKFDELKRRIDIDRLVRVINSASSTEGL